MSFDLVVVGGCASKVLGSRGSRESNLLIPCNLFRKGGMSKLSSEDHITSCHAKE